MARLGFVRVCYIQYMCVCVCVKLSSPDASDNEYKVLQVGVQPII